MDATIRFPDEDDDVAVRSLGGWLREDPDVSRDIVVKLVGKPAQPEDQGGAFAFCRLQPRPSQDVLDGPRPVGPARAQLHGTAGL